MTGSDAKTLSWRYAPGISITLDEIHALILELFFLCLSQMTLSILATTRLRGQFHATRAKLPPSFFVHENRRMWTQSARPWSSLTSVSRQLCAGHTDADEEDEAHVSG